MIPLKQALTSSVGKKYLMSVSGLAMVGFVITHLLGNLQLFFPEDVSFNEYAKALHDLGPLIWVAEIALIGIFLLHVWLGVRLSLRARQARGSRYEAGLKSKGGPSHNTMLTRGMIVGGLVLLVFIPLHVLHMKYGLFSPPEIANAKVMIGGEEATNLHARVVYAFKNPVWVVVYMAAMVALGVHLRHGFWSAFQSLGALNRRLERPVVVVTSIIAILLALGFFFIPLILYIRHGMGA